MNFTPVSAAETEPIPVTLVRIAKSMGTGESLALKVSSLCEANNAAITTHVFHTTALHSNRMAPVMQDRLETNMRLALLLTSSLLLLSCNSAGNKPKPPPPRSEETPAKTLEPSEPADAETRVEMVNVIIRLDPELPLHVRRLSGKLLRTKKTNPPTFDDKLSYIIAVDSAEIAISTAAMSHMMNTYVFGEPDAPLKNLRLSIVDGQIKQEGTIRKGPGISFETTGDMSPTPEGLIRIHPQKIRAAHLPVKGLMKLFGVDMAKLINTRNSRGISVDDDDIILDPAQALPPPKMRGRVTAVRIEGDQIVQLFGTEKPDPAKKPAGNYMWYRGGILRFGKLTMHDTDMRLIDADPRDPFDFSPDHYKDHLVAGYSKNTPSGGLLVYMPDYGNFSTSLTPPK